MRLGVLPENLAELCFGFLPPAVFESWFGITLATELLPLLTPLQGP